MDRMACFRPNHLMLFKVTKFESSPKRLTACDIKLHTKWLYDIFQTQTERREYLICVPSKNMVIVHLSKLTLLGFLQ